MQSEFLGPILGSHFETWKARAERRSAMAAMAEDALVADCCRETEGTEASSSRFFSSFLQFFFVASAEIMSLSLVCTHRPLFSYCCPSDGFRIDQTQRRRTAEMSQGHTRGRRRIDSPCGGQTKKVSRRLGFVKFISGIELGESSSSSSKKPQQQQRFGKNLLQCRAQKTYTVEIEHEGENHRLEVAEDETILSVALEAGLDVPYDCQLGVCMTCPAKLEQGEVNQKEGMLSEDVIEKGYALMCVSYPLSDCKIRSIPEDELLSLQLVTAND